MTWTAILYNGDTHFKQVFHGPHDSHKAIKEAQTKFGQSAINVVAVIPGENPVYINKQEEEEKEL
jgi:hypothetical protein